MNALYSSVKSDLKRIAQEIKVEKQEIKNGQQHGRSVSYYNLRYLVHQFNVKHIALSLYRGTPTTLKILDDIWNQEDLINDKWWENAAFMRVSEFPQHKDKIGYLPFRPVNVYPEDYQTGDWCLHFAGGNKEQRIKSMRMKHPELRGIL